ncbi:MAG TPA: polysaccharide biosynthesis/export family protein [Candidatus Eisenbacteria bacterium]|nr:polysaccharide biosynthesis/export family protein [Candidatus Eisenbacteria bacterium]
MASALLAVLFLVSLPAVVLAQRSDTPPPGDRNYKIGIGDLLKIEVVGRPDLSGQMEVGIDGRVTLPVVGAVKAADRTTAELSNDLSRRISLVQRVAPEVIVSVLEYRSRKVFVLGSVLIAGTYSIGATAMSVWDAIAEAGGPTEDANLSAVEVIPGDISGGSQVRTVDVAAAIRDGKLDDLEPLRPGDTVRVPRGGGSAAGIGNIVYIFGAVGAQGPHPFDPGMGLVQALIRSTPSADANFSKIEIVRNAGPRIMRMEIDLNEYLGHASLTGNPELQAGDTIFVPRSGRGFAGVGWLGLLGVLGTVLGLVVAVDAIANNNH